MPERIDVPEPDSSSEAAAETPTIDEPAQPRWRRPVLLIAGVSLLTLGAFINADRLELAAFEDPPEALVIEEELPAKSSSGSVHRGVEGKMGRPSTRQKSGMYAMKGPRSAVPQMSRSFDPNAAGRNAGILGVEGQGHYLGGPFAVGNDDAEVWGGLSGTEIGEAYGVGELGLVGTGRGGGGVGLGDGHEYRSTAAERYAEILPSRFVETGTDAKSTFSIDVDTASYANVRRFLLESSMLPPADAVRTEELINYFDYDYPHPSGATPFSLTTEVGPCPWNAEHRLVHVGIEGKAIARGDVPPRNLVFLLDVSGSMSADDKLPLVKHGLASLTEQLDARDRVAVVVYAGAAGVVLPPTSGADKATILAALDRLEAGGSTNGGEGIEAAYRLAERSFIDGGVNRVLLATDGDFNVGLSDHDALVRLIEQKRESGVFLSVLGVGTGNLNDHTMEQIADKGNGNYSYIDGMLEARKVLVQEAGGTLVTIAKDVKIQVEFDEDQVSAHRLIGYENRVLAHADFDDDSKDAGEIGAGHTVTAIYEIVPNKEADSDDPLMQLDVRYKQPDGDRSRKISVEVEDGGSELAATSEDYRFAAAVAAFGEALRGARGLRYAEILSLAEGALGDDPYCYRHQFLDLVVAAGRLGGEQIRDAESSCTVHEPPVGVVEDLVRESVSVVVDDDGRAGERGDAEDWPAFMLEVLRLLPPFLALPMFVMAMRRPRRRR